MFKSLAIVIAVMTGMACFTDEASARPWLNRYDYYYGPGSAPRASAYYGPYSPGGYYVVPRGSNYYNPYARGYILVPPGSYYYSPAYPPTYNSSYPTYSNNWYWFKW